jgi:pimeloyl-ACP methyl ester carboxylesterase
MSRTGRPVSSTGRAVIQAPDIGLVFLEMRFVQEVQAMLAASPMLRLLGRGDRHPVLVMPGFSADDSSTMPLRSFIRSWGYWVHASHGGANGGPTPEALEGVEARLHEVHGRHGRKVTLVGWSMGGLFARRLARRYPEMVRQVITLASPLQLTLEDRSSLSFVIDQIKHRFDPDFARVPEHELGPLPVPSTSIYTRGDGVARWYTFLDVVDDEHENVEVYGTHAGQGFNPFSMFVVADRLAQPESGRRPFRAPFWLRPAYPAAPSWRVD